MADRLPIFIDQRDAEGPGLGHGSWFGMESVPSKFVLRKPGGSFQKSSIEHGQMKIIAVMCKLSSACTWFPFTALRYFKDIFRIFSFRVSIRCLLSLFAIAVDNLYTKGHLFIFPFLFLVFFSNNQCLSNFDSLLIFFSFWAQRWRITRNLWMQNLYLAFI